MAKSANLYVRIEPEIKEQAEKRQDEPVILFGGSAFILQSSI